MGKQTTLFPLPPRTRLRRVHAIDAGRCDDGLVVQLERKKVMPKITSHNVEQSMELARTILKFSPAAIAIFAVAKACENKYTPENVTAEISDIDDYLKEKLAESKKKRIKRLSGYSSAALAEYISNALPSGESPCYSMLNSIEQQQRYERKKKKEEKSASR